jgi:hypothetical protein
MFYLEKPNDDECLLPLMVVGVAYVELEAILVNETLLSDAFDRLTFVSN